MKPIITLYGKSSNEETKKFDGFLAAAFWIGMEHSEDLLGSVKVRMPTESYDSDVAAVTEFTNLLVQRQINFTLEFFAEPAPVAPAAPGPVELNYSTESGSGSSMLSEDVDFETELTKMKVDYEKGAVSKKQYDARRGALLKRWKDKVEGRLGK